MQLSRVISYLSNKTLYLYIYSQINSLLKLHSHASLYTQSILWNIGHIIYRKNSTGTYHSLFESIIHSFIHSKVLVIYSDKIIFLLKCTAFHSLCLRFVVSIDSYVIDGVNRITSNRVGTLEGGRVKWVNRCLSITNYFF